MTRRVAFACVAILALAMFARPLFRGEVLTFRDHGDYFQPLRFFTADELRHFRLPLWNPYNASGEPWLANPQTGVFYPPAWIFLVLPFATAYIVFLFLHVVLLGWGAFLLFSRIASPRGALLGALMLMLFGPTLSMLDISNNLTTFAWLPLVLWCAMADIGPMPSAAAIAMSFLAGEPFFAAAGAVMFALIRRKNLVDIALTAFCLAAVELIPFLAIIAGSDRAGNVPREEVLRDSMTFADWLRIVVPGGTTHQHFIPIVYVGIVPALLALIGIRDRRSRGWLVLLALSIVISAGSGELLTRLPLTIIRYPARVVPLGALAIAALAVIGFSRLERFRWIFLLAVALIIIDLVPRVAPLLQSGPFDPHVPYPHIVGRDGKIARLMPPKMTALDRLSQPLRAPFRRVDGGADRVGVVHPRLFRRAAAARCPRSHVDRLHLDKRSGRGGGASQPRRGSDGVFPRFRGPHRARRSARDHLQRRARDRRRTDRRHRRRDAADGAGLERRCRWKSRNGGARRRVSRRSRPRRPPRDHVALSSAIADGRNRADDARDPSHAPFTEVCQEIGDKKYFFEKGKFT